MGPLSSDYCGEHALYSIFYFLVRVVKRRTAGMIFGLLFACPEAPVVPLLLLVINYYGGRGGCTGGLNDQRRDVAMSDAHVKF